MWSYIWPLGFDASPWRRTEFLVGTNSEVLMGRFFVAQSSLVYLGTVPESRWRKIYRHGLRATNLFYQSCLESVLYNLV